MNAPQHQASLPIVDRAADAAYLDVLARAGLNVNSFWVTDYVDFEMRRSRHVFASSLVSVDGKAVLEVGCNVGATAIVLASLGARVTAIDVDDKFVQAARFNALRYGFEHRMEFQHVPDTRRLPYPAESFDVISCNSVLEYVADSELPGVLKELDRVLRPGGQIGIVGTSNRLWPKEPHSHLWLTNYVPRALDPVLPTWARRRGVSPWSLRSAFRDYEDLGNRDGGQVFLGIRRAMGLRASDSPVMSSVARALARRGVSVGMLCPMILLLLQKPQLSCS
jgi:ubiquinone/menaquinone biosynthesis C-methylase UbiE